MLILIFKKSAWEQFLHYILCMIFEEMFFMLYFINLPNFMVWLTLLQFYFTLLETLVDMCIAICVLS